MMKKILLAAILAVASTVAFAANEAITVYKDPYCGCCKEWVKYLRDSGYRVKVVDSNDMDGVKNRLGVPQDMRSCHTAVVDKSGQILEGHVPGTAIRKVIAQPLVRGVAVPGMPPNAPGMGKLDGELVTVDFSGKPFSKD